MRLVPLIVIAAVVLAAVFALPAAAQQPPSPPSDTTISGGGLLHSVRLAPVDQAAFLRRLDLPPLFDDAPETRGPSYTVTSPYWDQGVRAGDNTQVLVDDDATYYPEGGFVRTRQAGEDIWTALDTEQRAILDRYIAVAASVSTQPSVFEVLREAGLKGEDIAITVGTIELTKDQRTKFWENAQSLSARPVSSALAPEIEKTALDSTRWIVFTLAEGRGVAMAYVPDGSMIVEPEEAARGIVIPVPTDWLVPVPGEQGRSNSASNGLAPQQIAQAETDGSPIWWLITIGGGTASIAVAIVLQRKLRSLRAAHR